MGGREGEGRVGWTPCTYTGQAFPSTLGSYPASVGVNPSCQCCARARKRDQRGGYEPHTGPQ